MVWMMLWVKVACWHKGIQLDDIYGWLTGLIPVQTQLTWGDINSVVCQNSDRQVIIKNYVYLFIVSKMDYLLVNYEACLQNCPSPKGMLERQMNLNINEIKLRWLLESMFQGG